MKKILALALLLIVLGLFASGCENANNDDSSAGAEQETATEWVQDAAASDGKEKSEGQNSASAAPKDLKTLFASKALKYTADYKVSAMDVEYEMTMAFDTPRYVTKTNVQGIETWVIFDDAGSAVVCSKTEQDWQCFKMAGQEPADVAVENSVEEGAEVAFIGECTVASQSGLRYAITGKDLEKSTVCYTEDGILLEITNPQMTMTATKITRSAEGNLFIPPAEPQDMPSLP